MEPRKIQLKVTVKQGPGDVVAQCVGRRVELNDVELAKIYTVEADFERLTGLRLHLEQVS